MKRVFIIHGWDFSPEMNWYSSVGKSLEKNGFSVYIPKMPDSHHPSPREWISKIVEVVGDINEDVYLIAHSIAARAVMKFLESEVPDGDKCGGVIFVGGWFNLSPQALPDDNYKAVAKPWLEMQLNFNNIRSKANKFVAFFSDNDPYVPMNNLKLFEDNLGAEVIIESGMGHFDEDSGVKELVAVVDKLVEIANA